MKEETVEDGKELIFAIAEQISKAYWRPLRKRIKEDKTLLSKFTSFLVQPEKIIFYMGETHLGIEYIGLERTDELKLEGEFEFQIFDFPGCNNLFEKIIGFEYDSSTGVNFSLPPYSEEMYLPTNSGADKLFELGWNFTAQNSIIGFNISTPIPKEGEFSRIINSFFFDADESGLKTRHIKWLDLIPIKCSYPDGQYHVEFNLSHLEKLLEHDLYFEYPMPIGFDSQKLPKINRFIEFFGNSKNQEPAITNFLSQAEYEFILLMYFSSISVHHQLLCKWQSEEKDNIQPDYFIVKPNGYADIVEFKLPILKTKSIVGKNNRKTFSAEISSYISQTRVYKSFFEDPNNRRWFEDKYGFKVYNPRRFLVVGRRSDFSSDEWREIIGDFRDVEIVTYDDLVDGVVVQFYNK